MRRILVIIGILVLFGLICQAFSEDIIVNSPWVYPATETPGTGPYTVLLDAGFNSINLVLWNHDNNYDFVNGKFVIAIKFGLSQVTINDISLTFDTEDLSGTTKPGDFPPGSIFPCPWKQYNVGTNLTDWQSSIGWQGPGDTSGIQVNINITVTGDPVNVKLYFLAWGYKAKSKGLQYTDTPYSEITATYPPPPPPRIPEVPMGSVMATGTMIAAFGAYFGLRKRKLPLKL